MERFSLDSFWEVLCYIAVAVFGVVGLLRRRWFIPALLALALLWSARLPAWSVFAESSGVAAKYGPGTAVLFVQAIVARFGVMFLAGAFIYQIRNVIPARWSLVALSGVVVLAASLLPNYRVLAAIPLAYAVIVSGALIHNKRLRLRTDLSYGVYVYAWPMQQLLVICGLAVLNPVVFAMVATIVTVPLAAVSWFLVEKPATSLKSRFEKRGRAPADAIGGGIRRAIDGARAVLGTSKMQPETERSTVKIVLAAYGTRGDVEPSLAVGCELVRRGHEVRWPSRLTRLASLKSAGFTAVAYGPDSQTALAKNSGANLYGESAHRPGR